MRHFMVICEDCKWIGEQEDCIKRQSAFEETEFHCPECYSVNLIELDDSKARRLEPVGV